MPENDLRVGVALSGGSAWGVAHVGALAVLLKNDIPIDCIAGTSAGAVAAAPFAFGVPIASIEEAAKKLEWKQISRFAYSRLGLRSNAALANLIRQLVGDADIEDAGIDLAIVATDIESGKEKVFREGDVAAAVCASSAIPGYFSPVEIGGVLYVDGGIANNLPITPLKDMGANFIIAVNLAAKIEKSRPVNMGEVVGRSFEVLFQTRDKNVASRVDALIEPDIASFHPRSFNEAEAIYQAGVHAAELAMPMIKAKLALRRAERSDLWQRVRRFFSGRRANTPPGSPARYGSNRG